MRRLLVGLCASALTTSALAGVIATFEPLGFLDGSPKESVSLSVSSNGNVVVGRSNSPGGEEAFRWSSNTGMQGLGTLGGSDFFSRATAVSGSGQVIVGMSVSPNGEEAFRWTATTGMVGLGALPGSVFNSWATGVSRDGSVVVGYGLTDDSFRAFRWTKHDGLVDIGTLPGGSFGSVAEAVSGNGDTVVGYSWTGAGVEAFVWTADGGMKSLGDLAGGLVESYARFISEDGRVIVGMSTSSLGYEAFRWTAETGMQSIVSCEGNLTSAYSTTRNGDLILGSCVEPFGERAWMWDEANGVRDLLTVLISEYGLGNALAGWSLGGARISADGRTLAGYGIYEGERQAWVVNLRGNVSEPRTLVLLGLGLAGLATLRRRKSSQPATGALMNGRLLAVRILSGFFALSIGINAHAAVFTFLDALPSGEIYRVSNDGLFTVGNPLGDLGLSGFGVTAVSADRQRIAGALNLDGEATSFWVDIPTNTIVTDLFGPQITPYDREHVSAMSASGEIVIGANNSLPMIWTPDAGSRTLPSDGLWGAAEAISADGNVIVGRVGDPPWGRPSDSSRVARWKDGVLDYFAPLAGEASTVSFTGDWIAGRAYNGEAFLWSETLGLEWLGSLSATMHYSGAAGVSADGTRVIGYSSSDLATYPYAVEPFLWERDVGMRSLSSVLIGSGADLGGCYLNSATAISPDGRWVLGGAVCPDSSLPYPFPLVGAFRSFIVDLDEIGSVPEPGSLSMVVFGLAALGWHRRGARTRS